MALLCILSSTGTVNYCTLLNRRAFLVFCSLSQKINALNVSFGFVSNLRGTTSANFLFHRYILADPTLTLFPTPFLFSYQKLCCVLYVWLPCLVLDIWHLFLQEKKLTKISRPFAWGPAVHLGLGFAVIYPRWCHKHGCTGVCVVLPLTQPCLPTHLIPPWPVCLSTHTSNKTDPDTHIKHKAKERD